jgi:hypothetical protein
MKPHRILVGLAALASFTLTASASITWDAWAVGTGSTTVSGPNVTFHAGSSANPVWTTGQQGNKAFYSTAAFNGQTVGNLVSLNYTLVSPADPTGLSAPYLNIYITDGTEYAMLLLDAMPVPLGQQEHVFSTAHYRVNEATGGALATMMNTIGNSSSFLWSFDDVKNFTIAAGVYTGMVAPNGGWPAVAGTADGISLGWGNRGGAANYDNDVTITDLSIVPEPTTMLAGALLLLPVAFRGFRMLRKQA